MNYIPKLLLIIDTLSGIDFLYFNKLLGKRSDAIILTVILLFCKITYIN